MRLEAACVLCYRALLLHRNGFLFFLSCLLLRTEAGRVSKKKSQVILCLVRCWIENVTSFFLSCLSSPLTNAILCLCRGFDDHGGLSWLAHQERHR